jgi:hypothetical protein
MAVGKRTGSIGRASVEFEKSALGPFLTHSIVVYPGRDKAEAALADYMSAAEECLEFTDSEGNTTTLSPMSFPSLGDESFALRMRSSLEFDVVQVRVDNVLINIMQAGFGAVDSALTEELARAAVERYR